MARTQAYFDRVLDVSHPVASDVVSIKAQKGDIGEGVIGWDWAAKVVYKDSNGEPKTILGHRVQVVTGKDAVMPTEAEIAAAALAKMVKANLVDGDPA